MMKGGFAAGECGGYGGGQFGGSVGAADGSLSVRGGDGREEGRDEDAKEVQGKRMTDEIEQDEAAAGVADIANHLN